MKQGEGKSSHSGYKREPIAHKINVGTVSEIGLQVVRTVPIILDEGRGYEAPHNDSLNIHHNGSQGRYK